MVEVLVLVLVEEEGLRHKDYGLIFDDVSVGGKNKGMELTSNNQAGVHIACLVVFETYLGGSLITGFDRPVVIVFGGGHP
jgi:hypothetical protein